MPKRSTRPETLFVREMVEAARSIIELIAGLEPADLAEDRRTRHAILWNFTVLGEAAAALPNEFRSEHSSVPWVKATRLRNRLVHGYWNISAQIVYDTAIDDLPRMIESLEGLLSALQSGLPSDDQIRAWADEAEAGHDVEELKRRGPRSAQSPQEIEDQS